MITQLAGNGRLLLTVNEDGQWNGLFYPYPGQFQHLRQARLGLFDERAGTFSWLGQSSGWRGELFPYGAAYSPASSWNGHGVSITLRDHVHPNHDLLIRTMKVRADPARPLRIFAYHSLQIAESMYQDTAYVDPERHSLVHFKRGYFFEFFSDPPFSHAVCGEHTLKGLQGTYIDAEDGRLEGRAVAHGAADSVMQWDIPADGAEGTTIRLFVSVGQSLAAVHQTRQYVVKGGPARFERESEQFWETWARRRLPQAPVELMGKVADVYRASVLVMRHAAGTNGSIIASPDTRSLAAWGDTYNFCWWRDGGYVSKAMDEAGLYENAQRFLKFAQKCQDPDGSFYHRHFPDGAIGSTWHPPPFLQIDQTATVVSAVWHHFKRGADPEILLELWPMVKGAANFLTHFRDPETGLPAASYDLWEERRGIHTYSTAAVGHALERAARIAEEIGKDSSVWRDAGREIREAALEHLWDTERQRFLRSLGPRDERVDSSILLALKLGLVPWSDPRARDVVDAVEARLWSQRFGGIARYEGDTYYGSENPWIICTLWLAEARLRLGDRDRCRKLIEWAAEHATPTQMLPEQVDALTGEPKSATPLTWSHSTFVDVIHKYQEPEERRALLDE
ncbi:MAG: glycoside hydrolase family 15 protein [Thermoplasmata archaeon]|nr:glycoside hydrolase family 15 protein [Thermoplasmata archaeon]